MKAMLTERAERRSLKTARRLLRAIFEAVLAGLSLSGFSMAFLIASLLARYSKDLAEVLACSEYIIGAIVVGTIFARLTIEVVFSDKG